MGQNAVVQKYGRAAVTVAVMALGILIAQDALAITAADVTAATDGSGAEESQSAAWKWILGLVVGFFVGRKILGMFGRG
ncbi:hypothetical protein [Acinetobacter colistiniresistens]|uniref:Uncharacterized protein n=1 Tax=Acinetobacter colistiniresistens TaxID=280145 RepID=A0A558EQ42_9GAMM|nr:hypothetical protein [Acinetobacter colistiniresistens]TVT75263.1 hypothetical protein FPV60_21580 [Acinetobacter colistiniresistens]